MTNLLNSNHERRVAVTCRYIDKLLAEIETALNASASKRAFPQYVCDVSPAQRRVIQDYIGQIRAQLVRVLDGQGIKRPPADIPVSRSLHSHLAFVEIAAEELKPEYMRGYGEIPPAAAVELNGISGELQSLVRQLDHYLVGGARENLGERLARLEKSGEEVLLLKKLESVVADYGMVEFRSTLSMILDRLEDNSFEIAIFGRVSSGKSSLLNSMLGTDVLPVGVTPITAVPTRLLYATVPAVHVWFANRQPELLDISQLPEFVAEQLNPGNAKHVTRIVVQLPSPRLRDGIAFVDTPGLGSLATRGAAETLAYLPRCDLGVVLIDAASTLTPDDLQTIRTLYDAAIPAVVLLSKADLLSAEDRSRVIGYVRDHIKEELSLDLAVRAVSVLARSKYLVDRWFDEDIAPLYGQRQELKLRSIRRKIGALRQSVEMALRLRLQRKDQISPKRVEQLRVVEGELRKAGGRLEEMRRIARIVANDLEFSGSRILRIAAATLVESWLKEGANDGAGSAIVRAAIMRAVQEQTESLRRRLDKMADKLLETVRSAATVLGVDDAPSEGEFCSVVREMPSFDPGHMGLQLKRSFYLGLLGESLSTSLMRKRLSGRIGHQLDESLSAYRALLFDWSGRTLSQMQRKFDSYATSYRAQGARLAGDAAPPAEQDGRIERDLAALENASPEQKVGT
ncbi:MAG TPA: dynamin family protein [Silvibacterium sp.]|nr:dynamin family protein [Silvibacterium sp.]